MKPFLIFVICIFILYGSFNEVKKHRSVSEALGEMRDFISFYSTQLNYRKPDCNTFYHMASARGYKYILFDEGRVFLPEISDRRSSGCFYDFLSKMGTTDTDGQISLCKEYLTLFGEMLEERKSIENNKIKVDIAVGVLCAFGVFIAFI